MKLFSPQAAKVAHNHKQEEDVAQVAFLTVTLNKLQNSINTENTNWEKRMKEQRELYGEEKIKLQEELRNLHLEVGIKEKRLKELLIPIDDLKTQNQAILRVSEDKLTLIKQKEEEILELQELLKDKLDNLTEREANIYENEIKIESRLMGIEEEGKMIAENHKKLNQERMSFDIERKQREKALAEAEEIILIKEKRNHEYINARTTELDALERSLKDRRVALDRAFKEVELLKKNNII